MRTAGTLALLLAALAVQGTAYHVNPYIDSDATTAFGATMTAGDWGPSIAGVLIVCESNGPLDDRNDNLDALIGAGGLCTTGPNDVTGTTAPAGEPAVGTWWRIDACSVTISVRQPGVASAAPLVPADLPDAHGVVAADCDDGGGATDDHAWTAEAGAFACLVVTTATPFTDNPSAPPTGASSADYALYVRALYLDWSYDGDGWYTPGSSAPGTYDLTDGPPDNVDNAGPPYDNKDHFHGHVAMFIDAGNSDLNASSTGSAEVTVDAPGGILSDDDNADNLGPADYTTNSCGGSPACPPGDDTPVASPNWDDCDTATNPGAPRGPVIRAP